MKFVLNYDNVFDYLIKHDLWDFPEKTQQYRYPKSRTQVERIAAKNFNLLVTLPEG